MALSGFARTLKLLSSSRFIALIVFMAGFIPRLAARAFLGEENFWTGGYRQYFDLARNMVLRSEYCLDTVYGAKCAFWPPVYPLFLAGLTQGNHWIVPITIAQAAVGALTAVFAFRLGSELFCVRVGALAGLAAALYPYYVLHDIQMQETGLLTCLAIATIYLSVRAARTGDRNIWALTGLVLGVAVLTRATMLPFAVLLLAWFLIANWRRALLAGAVFFLVVSPWLFRNQLVLGAPVLATQTGRFLWIAHNDKTFSHYPVGSIDDSEIEALNAIPDEERNAIMVMDEIDQSQYFERLGLEYIAADPLRAVSAGSVKLTTAFSWQMSPRAGGIKQLVYFASYFPVLLLGVLGFLLSWRRWREFLPIYLLFGSFMAGTAIFWAHTSHRSYLDVYLMIFAAFTAVTVLDRLLRRRSGAAA